MTARTRFILSSGYLALSFLGVLVLVYYTNVTSRRLVEQEVRIVRLTAQWSTLHRRTQALQPATGPAVSGADDWRAAYGEFTAAVDGVVNPSLLQSPPRARQGLDMIAFAWPQPRRCLENIGYALDRIESLGTPPASVRAARQAEFYRLFLADQTARFLFVEDAFLRILSDSAQKIGADLEARRRRLFLTSLFVSIVAVGLGLALMGATNREITRLNRALERGIAEKSREIEERRLAEAALRQGEERYRAIVESIEEGYFELDFRGRVVASNRALARVLGRATEELHKKFLGRFSDRPGRRRLIQGLREVYQTGRPTVLPDHEQRRGDGVAAIIELSVALRHGSDGEPCGFRGLARDVTERRRLQEQLSQMERLDSLGTLAGGIAHDFNNLLMAIEGNVVLAGMGLPADSPARGRLQNVEGIVRSAAQLTRQLLGFARGGKYEVKPILLSGLLKGCARVIASTRKDIEIREAHAPDLWASEVDRGQMEQVFMNLLMNAAQAMPRGGRIELRTDNQTLGETEAGPLGLRPGRFVRAQVIDNGIGIPPEALRRVFEPFFTTRGLGRGTGLGLASAFGIAKSHGGVILVESAPGQGSVFSVLLPASDKPASDQVSAAVAPPTGHETLLLVDDEEAVREVCADMLRELGYRVLASATGEEAVATYRERSAEIDLVVLDMVMPGMDGRAVQEALRAFDPGVRVLLASGYRTSERADELGNLRAQGFVQKPFDRAELASAVRRALDSEWRG